MGLRPDGGVRALQQRVHDLTVGASNRCEIVVKIGGSTLGGGDTSLDDIARLRAEGRGVVVVHGGGATITEWLARIGIEATFVRGLRVTDEPSLDVVIAVLAGLVNTRLVAGLQERGAPAVGLTGVDGALLRATPASADLGRVGEVRRVDAAIATALLAVGAVPVIAPIAVEVDSEDRLTGGTLNVNADTAAGAIAAALGAERLVFLTDVPGIKDGDGAVLGSVSAREAERFIESGTIGGGMIPKARAALAAHTNGAATRIIDGREPGALLRALAAADFGTTIG